MSEENLTIMLACILYMPHRLYALEKQSCHVKPVMLQRGEGINRLVGYGSDSNTCSPRVTASILVLGTSISRFAHM